MPSPVPERNRNVYFVGAGLSCALGMPNTAALITDVKRELGWDAWRHSAGLDDDLIQAFEASIPMAVTPASPPMRSISSRSYIAMSRSALGCPAACQKPPTSFAVSSSESPTSWSSALRKLIRTWRKARSTSMRWCSLETSS